MASLNLCINKSLVLDSISSFWCDGGKDSGKLHPTLRHQNVKSGDPKPLKIKTEALLFNVTSTASKQSPRNTGQSSAKYCGFESVECRSTLMAQQAPHARSLLVGPWRVTTLQFTIPLTTAILIRVNGKA